VVTRVIVPTIVARHLSQAIFVTTKIVRHSVDPMVVNRLTVEPFPVTILLRPNEPSIGPWSKKGHDFTKQPMEDICLDGVGLDVLTDEVVGFVGLSVGQGAAFGLAQQQRVVEVELVLGEAVAHVIRTRDVVKRALGATLASMNGAILFPASIGARNFFAIGHTAPAVAS